MQELFCDLLFEIGHYPGPWKIESALRDGIESVAAIVSDPDLRKEDKKVEARYPAMGAPAEYLENCESVVPLDEEIDEASGTWG